MIIMLAYTYIEKGKFALVEKPKPTLIEPTDAIVRVTMSSICSSDLHIKHGSVPRAVPGITVGHEMVGVVEEVDSEVTNRHKTFLSSKILRDKPSCAKTKETTTERKNEIFRS